MNVRDTPAVYRIRRCFTIDDPHGLHGRPAALFARTASLFHADVVVECGNVVGNGKRLMELLGLCAQSGEALLVVARGADAANAMQALEAVLADEGIAHPLPLAPLPTVSRRSPATAPCTDPVLTRRTHAGNTL